MNLSKEVIKQNRTALNSLVKELAEFQRELRGTVDSLSEDAEDNAWQNATENLMGLEVDLRKLADRVQDVAEAIKV